MRKKINWTKQLLFDAISPEPNTGCWLWLGGISKWGYGMRHPTEEFPYQLIHRLSYHLYNGPFDIKMHVLHKCDTPACCNPDHLYLGTQADNNLDRDKRGRQRTQRGSNHKLAKLTEEDVIKIRQMHDPKKNPSRKLASIFGVSQRKIMHILHRQSWAHV